MTDREKSRQRRRALVADPLLADFYAMLRMVVDEPSQPARYQLSVELWERAFEIVERSVQLNTKPARDKPRRKNALRIEIERELKMYMAKNPRISKHDAVPRVLKTFKLRKIKLPAADTVRKWKG